VIWRKKSISTAIAAIIQNETNAGILHNIPTKNANTSQKEEVQIEGPIFPNPFAILY